MVSLETIAKRVAKNESTWLPKKDNELETGYYDKNLNKIDPDEREIGAILYVTKDFNDLYDFLKHTSFKKLKKKVEYAKNDFIIDVFNGWLDIIIKVYAKIDYKKRHQDYLKELRK